MAALPMGTVTMLFTDIEGSTLLLQRLGERYDSLLAEYRGLMRVAFHNAGGYEVGTEGDSFFVTFPRAIDAVTAAIQAQRAIAAHTWPEGMQFRTRLGIHTGEPRVQSGDYVGLDVHRTARIAAVGHGGQMLVSETTRNLVAQTLPAGVELRDLGQYALKDLPQPEHIYQLVVPGLPGEFPPLKVRPVAEPAMPLPESPYKLLDYYEPADSGNFFGRDHEARTLSALIHAHRLVLLYGPSGAGKTSLLLAGIVKRLEQAEPPYDTIYVRALGDPALAIRRVIERRIPHAALPQAGLLVDFLAAATGTRGRVLVIILDQFEEFFIRLSPRIRAAFIDELGHVYDARDAPVRVVLSLREDWLAAVSEVEARIPEVFSTRMRVLPLTRDQAEQAITAPVARLGVDYDPALVKQLLDDLAGDEDTIIPPQLQLVCSALYAALGQDERVITLAHYKQLGGPRGVLGQYVEDELARLGRDERVLARRTLEELVTSQNTKAVKTGAELALMLAVELEELQPVLEKLVRARLLRVLERESAGSAYELAHEYLIREIGLGAETQKRKQAKELIQQEVENHRRFGTLLAGDKLALVFEVREVLRLDAEEQGLLLCSALVGRHKTSTYWLKRVGDETLRIAIAAECLRDSRPEVREWTVEVLSTWDAPEVCEKLVDVAMNDESEQVRRLASVALMQSSGTAVAALMKAEGTSSARLAEALAHILAEAGTLPRLPLRTRLHVLRFLVLHRINQAGSTLFSRTLGGAAGAAVWTAALLAPLAYADPAPFMEDLGTSSPANVALIVGMAGGVIGALLGGEVAFWLTLADILIKKVSVYLRAAGAIAAGVTMGLLFVVLRAAGVVGWTSTASHVVYFAYWSGVGALTWGAAAPAIPVSARRRYMVLSTARVTLITGGASFIAMVVLSMLFFGRRIELVLEGSLQYAILLAVIGGGMALGIGLVVRLSKPGRWRPIAGEIER